MANLSLETKASQTFSHRLRLSRQMKLSIALLQMPLFKLNEFVKEQVEVNPLLETVNLKSNEPGLPAARNGPDGQENPDYENKENLVTQPETLQEHLLRQLSLVADSPEERETGKLIIGNLDDNGYLRCSIEEITALSGANPGKAKKTLSLVQTFDPLGVCARDLRECLLIQLRAKKEGSSLAARIIDKYLPCLEKKRYGYIAKMLGETEEKIKESIEIIATLEPKPGRSFSRDNSPRLVPDVILKKSGDYYQAILNDEQLPQININHKYRLMAAEKNASEEVREYLKERLEAARSLICAIEKRKETLREITRELALAQKGFLDNGEPELCPLTLGDIAKKIGKHKSTICRAIANKYVQTPWGILELSYFFDPGVRQKNGLLFSSKAIKSEIKGLLGNEETPLTDREIVDSLRKKGIHICRRTLAKYRMQLKIPSSRLRGK